MKIVKDTCTRGTNIYFGNDKRQYINKCIDKLISLGYTEIQLPILQDYKWFENKVGEENNNMMYRFTDKGGRDLCLAPEYTAIVMKLQDAFQHKNNIKLFYVGECFRAERPQKGRYRQFTQLGVEILNPNEDTNLSSLALELCEFSGLTGFTLDEQAKRGLDYYENGKGFEIRYNESQIVGGGIYDGGVGFAIGVDRLLNGI